MWLSKHTKNRCSNLSASVLSRLYIVFAIKWDTCSQASYLYPPILWTISSDHLSSSISFSLGKSWFLSLRLFTLYAINTITPMSIMPMYIPFSSVHPLSESLYMKSTATLPIGSNISNYTVIYILSFNNCLSRYFYPLFSDLPHLSCGSLNICSAISSLL